jgi:acyl-CoA dehydrogenase
MSEIAAFFRDTAERVLGDTVSDRDINAAEERVLPAALFRSFEETGVLSMLADEDHGGVGASLADAVTILRVAGAAAAPGPLLETLLGRDLLARAGTPAPEGALTLAFADGEVAPKPGETVWSAPSTFHDVPWGGLTEGFLVVAPLSAGGLRLILSRPGDWTIEPGADAAGEPRDRLSAASVAVQVADLPDSSFDEAFRAAAMLRAGQILGALEWTFQRSAEYVMERKQFGKELGKFQVVQQMLAEMADNTLASAVITDAAAAGPSRTLVASARSRLADAADVAITVSHQVHGALGFSREYALNHRTRRLMAWRDDYGSVPFWRRALAADFIDLSRDAFWPAVSDAGLS